MDNTTIKQSWDDYQKLVVPANASAVQIRECRYAFYGGAVTTLSILMGCSNLSEQQGIARLSILHSECLECIENLKKEAP